MWTMLFAATTIICGVGWIARYVSCMALIYYMEKKGYMLPNDEEIKECTSWVIDRLFGKKGE